MACDKYNNLIFICDSSLQSSLFRDFLEKSLDIPIQMTTIEGLSGLTLPEKSSVLVIIDNTHINEDSLDLYIKFLIEKSMSGSEVLINSPNNVAANLIAKWPNMVGVFFAGDEMSVVAKGMKKVLEGELWLSRKLTNELITSYRNKDAIVAKSTANLTTREKEIMQLLVLGASNIQIAETLFVSENTVKTHLYNVFKKINVKNRMQAFMWAKNNHYNDLPL
ncbi:LuxR C-terminal-related transcriptional regulator [Photobacterium alginatilyticum]|jgi:LuxR family transcriptional regulator of csgAB operon|uniref:Helix-turn-helix transcriptional regulator n=1 Tax=Photobacterium alginatilyticum TaxID=1775171 RepID=A0ABW9YQI5_9GAMM|nr:LuxR C-terminal-related transcriptional regulator [Photobacterium alginatilyticum]NBI56116.1 helix-turn-helix transcriptional regulator [Photobacterium alginatilyticum]